MVSLPGLRNRKTVPPARRANSTRWPPPVPSSLRTARRPGGRGGGGVHQRSRRYRRDGDPRSGGDPVVPGYHGFPASICSSVNDRVVHGIPAAGGAAHGDLVSIDCGAILDGWHGDAAVTFGWVG